MDTELLNVPLNIDNNKNGQPHIFGHLDNGTHDVCITQAHVLSRQPLLRKRRLAASLTAPSLCVVFQSRDVSIPLPQKGTTASIPGLAIGRRQFGILPFSKF